MKCSWFAQLVQNTNKGLRQCTVTARRSRLHILIRWSIAFPTSSFDRRSSGVHSACLYYMWSFANTVSKIALPPDIFMSNVPHKISFRKPFPQLTAFGSSFDLAPSFQSYWLLCFLKWQRKSSLFSRLLSISKALAFG